MNFRKWDRLQISLDRDGNQWCAKGPDFINLMVSDIGFGDSIAIAIVSYLEMIFRNTDNNFLYYGAAYAKIFDDTDDSDLTWNLSSVHDSHDYLIYFTDNVILSITYKYA
jgi:hypothetical protein